MVKAFSRRVMVGVVICGLVSSGLGDRGKRAQAATYAGTDGVIAYGQFMSNGPQILTVNPATREVTNLSKRNFDDMEPSFSPNGTKVLFVSDGSIYTMTPTGTSRTDLTPGATSLDDPAWSANGAQIVYDNNGDIGVMKANGSAQHLITHTGGDSEPDWSPDGTLIAFYRDANGVAAVFTITPSGSRLKDLSAVTDPQHKYYDNEPAWAPDSQHLLVASDRAAGGNQIFEMSRTGTTVHPVTDAYDGPDSAVFSPDSTSIAYTAGNGQGTTEVFTQPLGGTGVPITGTEENSITGHLSWQAKATSTA